MRKGGGVLLNESTETTTRRKLRDQTPETTLPYHLREPQALTEVILMSNLASAKALMT